MNGIIEAYGDLIGPRISDILPIFFSWLSDTFNPGLIDGLYLSILTIILPLFEKCKISPNSSMTVVLPNDLHLLLSNKAIKLIKKYYVILIN